MIIVCEVYFYHQNEIDLEKNKDTVNISDKINDRRGNILNNYRLLVDGLTPRQVHDSLLWVYKMPKHLIMLNPRSTSMPVRKAWAILWIISPCFLLDLRTSAHGEHVSSELFEHQREFSAFRIFGFASQVFHGDSWNTHRIKGIASSKCQRPNDFISIGAFSDFLLVWRKSILGRVEWFCLAKMLRNSLSSRGNIWHMGLAS